MFQNHRRICYLDYIKSMQIAIARWSSPRNDRTRIRKCFHKMIMFWHNIFKRNFMMYPILYILNVMTSHSRWNWTPIFVSHKFTSPQKFVQSNLVFWLPVVLPQFYQIHNHEPGDKEEKNMRANISLKQWTSPSVMNSTSFLRTWLESRLYFLRFCDR